MANLWTSYLFLSKLFIALFCTISRSGVAKDVFLDFYSDAIQLPLIPNIELHFVPIFFKAPNLNHLMSVHPKKPLIAIAPNY